MRNLMLSVSLTLLALLSNLPASARDYPTVQPEELASKYGRPDKIVSSEYEKPRPPLVVRLLRYEKERVQFILLADAPVGSPPPYKSWRLLGASDPIDKTAISMDEAERRLAPRRRK